MASTGCDLFSNHMLWVFRFERSFFHSLPNQLTLANQTFSLRLFSVYNSAGCKSMCCTVLNNNFKKALNVLQRDTPPIGVNTVMTVFMPRVIFCSVDQHADPQPGKKCLRIPSWPNCIPNTARTVRGTSHIHLYLSILYMNTRPSCDLRYLYRINKS
jgi:hypothetical protein